MDKELTEIFKNKPKRGESGGGGIDWEDRKSKYIAAVSALYAQITQALAEPRAQGQVEIQQRPKQLTENYLGTYTIDDLILLIGNEQVRFSPRGRNIVGSSGRVDVLGERAEATLVVQVDGRWGVVQTRQPTLRVVPFDESTLAEVLRAVMRD